MKKIIICTSFLFFVIFCFSQEKKIKLYFYYIPTNNYLHFKPSKNDQPYQITLQKYFNNFGFSLQYKIKNKLYIRSGINDTKQNFVLYYHPDSHYDTYNGYTFTSRGSEVRYWEVPLLLSFKMNDNTKINIFHSVGITTDFYYCNYNGYITYLTMHFGDIWSGRFYIDNIHYYINKQIINATFSVQSDLFLFKNSGISIESVINYGLMNFFKETKRSNIISIEMKIGIFI